MARRRRGQIRTGSKKVQSRLKQNARFLRDHPEHAVPTCRGRCPLTCPYKRARKALPKVHAARDDVGKLKKLGKRGPELARAYAAVLRIAQASGKELEYLQNARTPQGLVAIAPWGKAPPPCHIGLQHRHDPTLRLLAAKPFVRAGDAVFATDEGLLCAHDGEPPDEIVDSLVSELGLKRASPNLARCRHLGDDWTASTYIELSWSGAGLRLRSCPACSTGHMLGSLRARMVTADILSIVDVDVHLPRLTDPQGGEASEVEVSIPTPVLRAYAAAEIDDAKLIEEAERARGAALAAGHEAIVVMDDTIYRAPFTTLVETLDPPEPLRSVTKHVVSRLDHAVVLGRGTAIELVHALWDEHGRSALEALTGAAAKELYDPDASEGELEQLMARLERELASQRVGRELPSYERVPVPADLADRVVRAYVAGGKTEAQKLLASAPDGQHVPIAAALVKVLGLPSPSWTVPPRDADFADQLSAQVAELVEARGEAYHDALVALSQATGSADRPQRADDGAAESR